MRRYHKLGAIFTACVALAGALNIPSAKPVFADSLAHEQQVMAQLKAESNQTYQKISQEKAKASSLETSIAQYNQSLANIHLAIEANIQETSVAEHKLHVLNDALHKNQVKYETDKRNLVGQFRAMYEGGPVSYLSVLLSASSFSDFLSRMYLLEIVAKKQKTLTDEVLGLKKSIAKQRQTQQVEYADLVKKQDQLHSFQLAQEIVQKRSRLALAVVKQNIHAETRRTSLLESQIQLTQSQIAEIQAETAKAEQLMQSASYVQQQRATLASVSANAVIQYAEQFMGTPYVWGGTTPAGFDCSGFTQYVLTHFGVSVNRTSEEQFAQGVPVDRNNLQPGDLVFFSTYAPGASHVGIYMGNGMMIDAEDRGVVIDSVFNSYWGPKYIGARQLLR